MKFVKNPYKMCEKTYNLMQALTGHLKEMIAQKVYDPRGRMLLTLFHPFLVQRSEIASTVTPARWTNRGLLTG